DEQDYEADEAPDVSEGESQTATTQSLVIPRRFDPRLDIEVAHRVTRRTTRFIGSAPPSKQWLEAERTAAGREPRHLELTPPAQERPATPRMPQRYSSRMSSSISGMTCVAQRASGPSQRGPPRIRAAPTPRRTGRAGRKSVSTVRVPSRSPRSHPGDWH